MQTSRREFLDDFVSYIGAAGDAVARNQAERLLNRILEKIWMLRGWKCFIDPDVWTFSTVANQRAYALPDHFGRISGNNRTVRNLTNGRLITPRDRGTGEEDDPTVGTSLEVPACPTEYSIAGVSPVQVQATGVACEVGSDDAADTTVRVFVEGLTTANLVAQRQVTLNGTTFVDVGAWNRILRFGKSYPEGIAPTTELTSSVGNVTLRRTAGAVSMQVLAPWQPSREHQTLVLTPVPDGVYAIGVPIFRAIERMYFDADPLPPNWTNAVFDGMTRFWRVADRDIAEDGSGLWPALKELIEYDNALSAQERRGRQPYRG
jgi:hypothetical protein